MDRETIINGLEIILNGCHGIRCEDCVFSIKEPTKPAKCGMDEEQIEEAAIALLKEQQKLINEITQRRANNGAFD